MAKNRRLPGVSDAEIEALQDKAREYADIRDQRQALTTQEVNLKGELLKLMKKHHKEEYEYEDVQVKLVHEEETVKVRIRKARTEEEE
jgi:hypothetical protein